MVPKRKSLLLTQSPQRPKTLILKTLKNLLLMTTFEPVSRPTILTSLSTDPNPPFLTNLTTLVYVLSLDGYLLVVSVTPFVTPPNGTKLKVVSQCVGTINLVSLVPT